MMLSSSDQILEAVNKIRKSVTCIHTDTVTPRQMERKLKYGTNTELTVC
jgi:RNA-binding protein YlmH